MNWRPMKSAPKGEIILVCTPKGDGTLAVITAFWGQPRGFKEPGWWGSAFSLASPRSDNEVSDESELRSGLVAITPKCWKPWPTARQR
jgi:hypothetical protein